MVGPLFVTFLVDLFPRPLPSKLLTAGTLFYAVEICDIDIDSVLLRSLRICVITMQSAKAHTVIMLAYVWCRGIRKKKVAKKNEKERKTN